MSELDTRARALAAERARPDSGERITVAVPLDDLFQELIGVLAGAMAEAAPIHGAIEASRERAAEYDRLRSYGFTIAEAGERVGVARTAAHHYEHLRDQGVA